MGDSDDNLSVDINPSRICRICLLQANKMQTIFTNSVVDGLIISIPDLLLSCIDLRVNEEDGLPAQICCLCKTQIINFYSFKQKCKRSEKLLQHSLETKITDNENIITELDEIDSVPRRSPPKSLLRKFIVDEPEAHTNEATHSVTACEIIRFLSDPILENVTDSEEDTENEMSIVDGEISSVINPLDTKGSLKCRRCGRSTTSLSMLKRHVEAHLGVNYKCRVCSRSYLHQASRNRHMRRSHIPEMCKLVASNEEPFSRNDPKNPPFKYTAQQCPNSFDPEMEQHTIGADEFFCDKCCRIFFTQSAYDCHISRHRTAVDIGGNGMENLLCQHCHRVMSNPRQYEQHMKLHEIMSIITSRYEFYACHRCRIIFLTSTDLSVHKQQKPHPSQDMDFIDRCTDDECTDYQFLLNDQKENEYVEGAYKCGECYVIFPNSVALKGHIVMHMKQFPCPFQDCGSVYELFPRLSLHISSRHMAGAQHKCTYCMRVTFSSYVDLQQHMKYKCVERKFACSHCDKKFFSKKSLNVHLKNLQGKKFVCNLCFKSFSQQGELTIHMRSHTGERPFQCNICKKSYKTASMRTAHMDTHIDGKTFSCSICEKKLQTRTSFRNHMRQHTEEKKHVCKSPGCTMKFFTKYHLQLHTSKIHKGKTSMPINKKTVVDSSLLDEDITMNK